MPSQLISETDFDPLALQPLLAWNPSAGADALEYMIARNVFVGEPLVADVQKLVSALRGEANRTINIACMATCACVPACLPYLPCYERSFARNVSTAGRPENTELCPGRWCAPSCTHTCIFLAPLQKVAREIRRP